MEQFLGVRGLRFVGDILLPETLVSLFVRGPLVAHGGLLHVVGLRTAPMNVGSHRHHVHCVLGEERVSWREYLLLASGGLACYKLILMFKS